MLPTLSLGSWYVHAYGFLLGLAAFVVGMYGYHRLRRLNIATSAILRAGLPVLIGGFAVALLAFHLLRLLDTGTAGQGLTIGWGVLGAMALAIASCRVNRLPMGRAFDLAVLPCPLGQAIGRLGCLAAGCCAGKATTSALSMYLPGMGGVWTMRYPTQLLDSAAHLFIFLALVAVERRWRRPFDGFLFTLYLALSSSLRFTMGFMREGEAAVVGPFSAMHLQGMAGVAVALALMVWNMGLPWLRRASAAPM